MKKIQKWAKKREKRFAKDIGGKRRQLSGGLWYRKEDAENKHFLFQLKSTKKQSYSIHLNDLLALEEHALKEHRFPVFAIEFIKDDFETERFYIFKQTNILALLKENK